MSDVTAGASGMYGTYDPENQETYLIVGADLGLRLNKTNLRLEYLARRTTFDTTDRARLKYLVPEERGNFVMKHGAYVEVEQSLTPELDLVGRVDGMMRIGNVEAASALDRRSSVVRYTIGTAYAIERGLRIKLSTELWQFSDRDPSSGRELEVSAHAALAGSF